MLFDEETPSADVDLRMVGQEIFDALENNPASVTASVSRAGLRLMASYFETEASERSAESEFRLDPQKLLKTCRFCANILVGANNRDQLEIYTHEDKDGWKASFETSLGDFLIYFSSSDGATVEILGNGEGDNHLQVAIGWSETFVFEQTKDIQIFLQELIDTSDPLELLSQKLRLDEDLMFAPIDSAAEVFPEASIWEYWKKWLQGFIDGGPIDWGLQHSVSLIADEIWKAGPQVVAQEIARIEAEHLSNKLPLAEEITFNAETDKFIVAPIPVENAPLMAALMARISEEFEDALSGHNGLSETSGDGRRIRRATTRYANNPQQAELTLTTVAKSLRRQIHETSELPDSPDNLALLEAVEDGVRGIRANHPEVAANREQLAQQALREIAPEDREMLEKAAPVLTAISEGDLAKDFADDIPELINDAVLPLPSGAPPLPGADASTRIFSRVSKMALFAEKIEKGLAKGAQAFDSDLAKTIRLAGLGIGVAGGVTAFLYQLVQIGLRLFGVI